MDGKLLTITPRLSTSYGHNPVASTPHLGSPHCAPGARGSTFTRLPCRRCAGPATANTAAHDPTHVEGRPGTAIRIGVLTGAPAFRAAVAGVLQTLAPILSSAQLSWLSGLGAATQLHPTHQQSPHTIKRALSATSSSVSRLSNCGSNRVSCHARCRCCAAETAAAKGKSEGGKPEPKRDPGGKVDPKQVQASKEGGSKPTRK
eukprot:365383-Chlamydomonas_euryale.AAC.8